MNAINKFIHSALLLSFVAAAFYLMGCASAEVNTGKIAFREGQYERAAQELKKGITANSTDAEGWYMLGYSLMEIGQYQEGAEALKKAMSLTSSYTPEIYGYYVDKYNYGINTYNATIKTYNTDSAGAMKTFNDLAVMYNSLTVMFPDSLPALQMKADTYYMIGRDDEALAIYEKILPISKNPQDASQMARILTSLGTKDYNSGNYDKAISTFDRVINLNYLPKDDKHIFTSKLQKGYAYYKMALDVAKDGINDEARGYLNNAISEIESLVTMTSEKAILSDSYQLLVSSYDALGMEAERDSAQTKLNALN